MNRKPVVATQDAQELVSDLESWAASARASQSAEQAEAAAKLTDEEVNRMVHELR
jgi:hypothetical protein